jgi:hypothetical protein
MFCFFCFTLSLEGIFLNTDIPQSLFYSYNSQSVVKFRLHWHFAQTFNYNVYVLMSLVIYTYIRSRYSDLLRSGRPRSRSSSPCRVKNCLFSTSSRPALRPTQPSIQWVPGAFSLGVKRQRREADHSPPTGVEIKKIWTYISTPPYTFMA